jgi:mannose-6-phosphate isomerase-like protein (cupin superfamily)
MSTPYTSRNLAEIEDSAAKLGFGELQESRFANGDLETEQTGLSYHRVKPGQRQPFGHRHEAAEEIYVVVGGRGRAKLDDEVLEVGQLDAIRVAPEVARAFEGGPEGLELLAFGPLRPDDRGEMLQGWWDD